MKDYFKAHPAFVAIVGSLTLVALIVLFAGVMPMQSGASEADENADRLRKTMKSNEGSALSPAARKQLEGEVAALRARVADLEAKAGPPAPVKGADKVLYAGRLGDLDNQIKKASQESSVTMENEVAFPKSPEDDLPVFLAKIEIAQKVLSRAVASGFKRIKQITATREGSDFMTADMMESNGLRRTVVEFELMGSMDSIAKLLHTLQQKDGFAIVPRFRAWREKPDDPETTLRIAVGGVEVGEAKAPEAKNDQGGFIFGR